MLEIYLQENEFIQCCMRASTGYCLQHQMTNINFHQTIPPLSLSRMLPLSVSIGLSLVVCTPGMQWAAIWSLGPSFPTTKGPAIDAHFTKEKLEGHRWGIVFEWILNCEKYYMTNCPLGMFYLTMETMSSVVLLQSLLFPRETLSQVKWWETKAQPLGSNNKAFRLF